MKLSSFGWVSGFNQIFIDIWTQKLSMKHLLGIHITAPNTIKHLGSGVELAPCTAAQRELKHHLALWMWCSSCIPVPLCSILAAYISAAFASCSGCSAKFLRCAGVRMGYRGILLPLASELAFFRRGYMSSLIFVYITYLFSHTYFSAVICARNTAGCVTLEKTPTSNFL